MDAPRLHNGTLTLQNIATGEHRTFEIRTQPEDAAFAPGRRVLSLLTGPDNEQDYTSFAFVQDDGAIRVFRKKQGPPEQPSPWDWYALMLEVIVSGASPNGSCSILREHYDVLEERRCLKCNRKLTDPESIRLGIGPTCRGEQ